MRRAILVAVLAAAPLLVAFFRWEGGSLSSADVDSFFRGRTVDGHYAVAIKKRVLGGENYLVTIHGYPTNLSVCEQLIAPSGHNIVRYDRHHKIPANRFFDRPQLY